MVYSVLISFSINQILQSAFLLWLWFKIYKNVNILMIEAVAYEPSAPNINKLM